MFILACDYKDLSPWSLGSVAFRPMVMENIMKRTSGEVKLSSTMWPNVKERKGSGPQTPSSTYARDLTSY